MQRYKEIREKPNLSLLILYFCWTIIWTRWTKVRQSDGLVRQAGIFAFENSYPYYKCSKFALSTNGNGKLTVLFDIFTFKDYDTRRKTDDAAYAGIHTQAATET